MSQHSVRNRAERIETMASQGMQPRISVITLGVNDLEKSLAFYRDGVNGYVAAFRDVVKISERASIA